MSNPNPRPGQLANGILLLVISGLMLMAMLSTCQHSSTPSTSTATTLPAGVQHSAIANVVVPPNARLEPDTAPGAERWDLEASYPAAIAQEEALLPVGKPLDSYPWCQKASLGGNPADNTTWLWGRPRDAVIVSVFPESNNLSVIVIRRTTEATMYCR